MPAKIDDDRAIALFREHLRRPEHPEPLIPNAVQDNDGSPRYFVSFRFQNRNRQFSIGRADIIRSTAVWLAVSISIRYSSALHFLQNGLQPLVSTGGRLPIHVYGLCALLSQAVVKRF